MMTAAVEVEWARLKAQALRALAEQDAVVIQPTAAIEQHGPHLPVMVDTRLGMEVALRAARRATAAGFPTVVAPPMAVGLSEHHMPFGGTLTLDLETWLACLRCLIRSFARHGFRKVLISNSHGGNREAMKLAADQGAAEPLISNAGGAVVAAAFGLEAAPAFGEILEDQPGIHHACEAETSMMMALEPDLVDASDLAGLAQPRPAGALAAGRAAYRWRGFAHITANGISGNPARSSAAKGERLLEAATASITALLTDPATFAPAQDLRGDGTGGVSFRDR